MSDLLSLSPLARRAILGMRGGLPPAVTVGDHGRSFTFTLPGAPRTKKNSSSLEWRWSPKAKKRVPKVIPSQAWREWRTNLKAYCLPRPEFRLRIQQPVRVSAAFYCDNSHPDSHGLYNGLADVLQELEVVLDDNWIRDWDGSRVLDGADDPHTEVTITLLDA